MFLSRRNRTPSPGLHDMYTPTKFEYKCSEHFNTENLIIWTNWRELLCRGHHHHTLDDISQTWKLPLPLPACMIGHPCSIWINSILFLSFLYRKLLDNEQIEVSYFAAGIIAHLLNDGPQSWKLPQDLRLEFQDALVGILLWNQKSSRRGEYQKSNGVGDFRYMICSVKSQMLFLPDVHTHIT